MLTVRPLVFWRRPDSDEPEPGFGLYAEDTSPLPFAIVPGDACEWVDILEAPNPFVALQGEFHRYRVIDPGKITIGPVFSPDVIAQLKESKD